MADNRPMFGLSINRDQKREEQAAAYSFAPPLVDDGAIQIDTQGGKSGLSHAYVLSMDAGVSSDAELIERYRTLALYAKIDFAVDEITNEAIVVDDEQPVVSLDLSELEKEIPENVREAIEQEFQSVLNLLKFRFKGYELFRRWYVDSRLVFHKIVDPNEPERGIIELRPLDPRKVKRVKEITTEPDPFTGADVKKVVDDYFIYVEAIVTYNRQFSGQLFGDASYMQGQAPKGSGIVKISPDAIAFVHSGLVDPTSGIIYGYLQKALKVTNQLRILEDSLVVYRLSRAPERRIFYIDTGNLPPAKAMQLVKQTQNMYRSKVVYDAKTGEIADQRRTMAMQEDFFVPRTNGNKGTEIDTLAGAENLGVIDDIEYFNQELWHSLNVPSSRFKTDVSAIFGSGAEITREEIKFSKFIARLRTQFSILFSDLLKTQLILKGILTEGEWEYICDRVQYKFATNTHFAEAKEAEVRLRRFEQLAEVDPFVGKYFSKRWVQMNILHMSEGDIEAEEAQMLAELEMQMQAAQGLDPGAQSAHETRDLPEEEE